MCCILVVCRVDTHFLFSSLYQPTSRRSSMNSHYSVITSSISLSWASWQRLVNLLSPDQSLFHFGEQIPPVLWSLSILLRPAFTFHLVTYCVLYISSLSGWRSHFVLFSLPVDLMAIFFTLRTLCIFPDMNQPQLMVPASLKNLFQVVTLYSITASFYFPLSNVLCAVY